MMYPFMTLDDGTEIVHSDYLATGKVKVYVEKADEKDGFHHFTCYVPSYELENVYGFSQEEIQRYLEVIQSTAPQVFKKDTIYG